MVINLVNVFAELWSKISQIAENLLTTAQTPLHVLAIDLPLIGGIISKYDGFPMNYTPLELMFGVGLPTLVVVLILLKVVDLIL